VGANPPLSPPTVSCSFVRPVFATNASGLKTWTATYTPFGGVHTSTGALPSARFPGQWFQSEFGLHQNWMRDYDPTTGRYLQADPLGLELMLNTTLTPTIKALIQ
jgi:RHS repeat-associated protein